MYGGYTTRGLVRPSPFGISTRLTGGALYLPALSSATMSSARLSKSRSNSRALSPSTPGAPSWFMSFHVSFRNSGVMWCASAVNLTLLSFLAFSATRSSPVDMSIPASACSTCFPVIGFLLPCRFPVYTALPCSLSTISRSDFPRCVRQPQVNRLIGCRTRGFLPQDHAGPPRFLGTSFSHPAVPSDPAEVSSGLADNGHLLLPSRNTRLCRPSVLDFTRLHSFTCVAAEWSPCLRLASGVAARQPKARSPVSG